MTPRLAIIAALCVRMFPRGLLSLIPEQTFTIHGKGVKGIGA